MNILIVDDEKLLVKGLKASLSNEGFNVYSAFDGKEGLEIVNKEKIDLIVLDIMLPVVNGISFLKKIRETMNTPVIMLTAKDDYADMVLGLELGADDYVTKPFNTRVLIARINSLLRRASMTTTSEEIIIVDDLKINLPCRTVHKGESEINLTAKEFGILEILAKNKGVVLSREKIFDLVWNELECDTRTVDVHISKLREKIEDDPANPIKIKTKWGVGYFMRKDRIE
ncbi:UNVERIFIED_CONTAM: DNA-binding response OmpR family regulator [Acetivibrio alkalicellulosi]